ncbi:Aste57867_23019 [Aphanomyces stellatus]|uniref:Aste57867_23019 protein n=1 Tax=Aphanomyces stellatus TaxID=120398 RepID=A0A485LMM8_9STRA|nr:hypothetical protein As57867_022948 [Aphanomyces stellatus]VFT99667.1 Aste57867_23019 [Aphanomyces stellatus]
MPPSSRLDASPLFSVAQLEQYYHMPLREVAALLGTYEGALIRACRRHGIAKWPYRQLSKINRQMRYMDDVLNKLDGTPGEKTTARRRLLGQRYATVHEKASARRIGIVLKFPSDSSKLKISFLLNHD